MCKEKISLEINVKLVLLILNVNLENVSKLYVKMISLGNDNKS